MTTVITKADIQQMIDSKEAIEQESFDAHYLKLQKAMYAVCDDVVAIIKTILEEKTFTIKNNIINIANISIDAKERAALREVYSHEISDYIKICLNNHYHVEVIMYTDDQFHDPIFVINLEPTK